MNTENRKPRSKQFTKEELLSAIEKFDNDKIKMAEFLGIGNWALREQLKKHGINTDKRIDECKSRTITKPTKEALEQLYNTNMTLVDIGKIYKVSNVTVKKWFDYYGIQLDEHSDTIKNKVMPRIVKTNQERYGVDYYYQSDEFKQKASITCMERYNLPYHPQNTTSKSEIEVLEFLNSLDNSFEKAHIHSIELDCYSDKFKIAIEYCGLYFHREQSCKGKEAHKRKYDICVENNIKLFTIFEDEWIYKKPQVKNILISELSKCETQKQFNQLEFKILSGDDTNVIAFLNNYHIRGAPSSEILNHYVLTDNDEILSVMSIGKSHKNNKEINISRYCSKYNVLVVGGMTNIFNKVKQDYIDYTITALDDNRWNDGELYSHLGFTVSKEIKPNYTYVSLNGKVNRKSKKTMSKTILDLDESKADYNEILNLGWDRIWDCGKKYWIYENRRIV